MVLIIPESIPTIIPDRTETNSAGKPAVCEVRGANKGKFPQWSNGPKKGLPGRIAAHIVARRIRLSPKRGSFLQTAGSRNRLIVVINRNTNQKTRLIHPKVAPVTIRFENIE
jgi:hypothetical protein